MQKIGLPIAIYRTTRFNRVIFVNVREALELDAEIILSDRHRNGDFTKHLRKEYPEEQVRMQSTYHGANRVRSINHLLKAAQREFFGFLHHDESTTAQETSRLADTLDPHPAAILAGCGVTAIDISGASLPDKDCIHLPLIQGNLV